MLQKITYPFPISSSSLDLEALNTKFDRVCVFDSNVQSNDKTFINCPQLIAIGCVQELIVKNQGNALNHLQQFIDACKGWLFGYLSYDLKNEIENLHSQNEDGVQFPLLHFFSPLLVLEVNQEKSWVHFDDSYISKSKVESILEAITKSGTSIPVATSPVSIQSKISKREYLSAVNSLQQHIRKGDIYEVNFCQEFYATHAAIQPLAIYQKLNRISEAPFAAYCNFGDHQLICSSPERFLQKHNKHLISQPIKGTIRRSKDPKEDDQLKYALQHSEKERSENVMIVDLVRNDLSRIAERGTVKADELFGAYTFKQVHQLISTISCDVKKEVTFTDIIRNTFPMGSMTGAPKVRAMQLIEQYEKTKRGLYSGAIGYINPQGDFDFNVVIRSILYNQKNQYISFMVGSAITDKANAEEEYEECLLKAKALFEVLET
ncbi:MAG TPA: aminodeoxychorismate synthase component I [Bacteroidia bacterium]|jgi:para-aminobenzoate synthetase component 1|nr:aminodeoxychorismate synthase component I [Bacteroidia bacterium]